MTTFSRIATLAKKTGSEWSEDKVSRLSASLAYYTVLSLAPMVVLAVSVAGLIFGQEAARGQIGGQLKGLVGEQAGEAIQAIVANAKSPVSGAIGTVVGVVVLLFGASGVFGELQDSLNTIWEVTPKPNRGVLGLVKDRFFSFTMVLGVAFLLLVSLVLSAGLAAVGKWFSGALPGGEAVWHVVNLVVSFGVVAVLFGLIYKVLPDVKLTWGDVAIGAAVTALLFTIGKFALGLYLGKAGVASPYGAAGSLVVLLTWVYYSAQILFLGAEFTQVYARSEGSRIEPARDAVPLTEAARAAQGIPHERAAKDAAAKAAGATTGTKDAAKPATDGHDASARKVAKGALENARGTSLTGGDEGSTSPVGGTAPERAAHKAPAARPWQPGKGLSVAVVAAMTFFGKRKPARAVNRRTTA